MILPTDKQSTQRYKRTCELKSSDVFDIIKKQNPDFIKDNKLTYDVVNNIINLANQKMADQILLTMGGVKLPERMGDIYISKYRPKHWNGDRLQDDYPVSRDLQKKIFFLNQHTEGFVYKFYWKKRYCGARNMRMWSFSSCRKLKRRLANILKTTQKDYFEG